MGAVVGLLCRQSRLLATGFGFGHHTVTCAETEAQAPVESEFARTTIFSSLRRGALCTGVPGTRYGELTEKTTGTLFDDHSSRSCFLPSLLNLLVPGTLVVRDV